MDVGTVCCDNLTDSKIASNLMESNSKYVGRRRRFLSSKRWRELGETQEIKQGNFLVKVIKKDNGFCFNIHNNQSSRIYGSIEEAKIRVFDVIVGGELVQYFKEKNIPIEEIKRKKVKNK
jgi:hypothetical protein